MKTLAFGGGVLLLGFLAGGGLQAQGKIGQFFFIGSMQIVPFAVAVAVLRYRLYDIDVLINRALVYGATTAAIAAAFFAGIVVSQAVLRPITGGSELAVAASTLLCFALIQPVRRRVQSAVDRRFYRSRYDAARTLDRFTEELAGEVDLSAVRMSLLAAISDTLQPSHASVWLRERLHDRG
jgi:branched-subunit amino acid ABC-type transport system permease component